MSHFIPLHPVQSAIVEVLAEKPGISMQELFHCLQKDHAITVSIQSIYKTTNRMIDEQMIVKNKGQFSLNLVWATHMLSCANTIQETYFSEVEHTSSLDLQEGERKDFYADSLLQLDPIYNSILLEITKSHDQKDYYSYYSHPYHQLTMTATEMRMWEGIVSRGIRYFCLYGNTTFLDKFAMKTMQTVEGAHQVASDDPPFPKDGYLLDVYEDYIVECVLPEQMSRHYSMLFQSVNSVEQFDPEFFADIFKMRTKCKLTVSRSPKKAAALRSKLKAFF